MPGEEKPLRADAERNRRRVVEAAASMFSEGGLEVGVGEIAARAGVGRATLFRNFPSKEHLIAAIVVARMDEAVARGRALLAADDPGGALFEFLEELVTRQQLDRALFEAVAETFLANEDIRGAYAGVLATIAALLERAQAAGAIRPDVGAVDVMMLVKGACQAASSFQHLDPEIGARQLDLIRGALSVPAGESPLRGRPATIADLERGYPASRGGDPEALPRAGDKPEALPRAGDKPEALPRAGDKPEALPRAAGLSPNAR